jgi:glycosyltransferase involved in cell wall biosynthesis
VAERVRFLGALPHEAVRAHMASAALFLQHSVTTAQGETEGLPSSIQEAMAAGAAVVATRHAGIAEAIEPGRNGLLVAEHDLDACAAAIERLLDNPQMAAEMARQARADAVERFDAKRLMERLENLLLAGSRQENQRT